MNLNDYKLWYALDEDHWYVSKVKQYNSDSIQLFGKALAIIASVINAKKNSDIYLKYLKFKPLPELKLFEEEEQILIDDYSKLFICLLFLKEDIIDQSHLEATNSEKFQQFSVMQKSFIEGENYDYFVKNFTKKYLVDHVSIYYRNMKSWLGKYGFYGEYPNKTAFITEMGYELINNYDNSETRSAIFLNQIKKYQIWNPTIDIKYKNIKIRPFYLLLEVLLKLPENYFTKTEYTLFITKLKSHDHKAIIEKIELIKKWREFNPELQKKYVQEIILIDKKKFKNRERTNFERLLDSASKEIDSFGFGGLIEKGTGKYTGTYILTDVTKAKNEINLFSTAMTFVEFQNGLDWIAHLGSKEGLSITQIIDLYISHGIALDTLGNQFTQNSMLKATLQDRLYEKEIEEYYVKNIKEINPDLEVLLKPIYGRQYSTHIGPIDILCYDNKKKEYVICELKRGQTSDETVGQILRYMGWVKKHLAKEKEKVHGILVGSDFNEKIDYSLLGMQSLESSNLISRFQHPFNDKNRPPLPPEK